MDPPVPPIISDPYFYCAAIPAVIMLSTSVTDTAHGIIRRTSRETTITRLLFRVARSVLRGIGLPSARTSRSGSDVADRAGLPGRAGTIYMTMTSSNYSP